LQHLLYTAVEHLDGPVAIRYPRGSGVGVELETTWKEIPIGKFEVLRPGSEVAILAVGSMVELAEKATDQLIESGVYPELINVRSIKPLDEELLLHLAAKKLKIITIEEGAVHGGFGSSILEFYSIKGHTDVEVTLMGIPDSFIEQGSMSEQRKIVGLTVENIVEQVKNLHPQMKQRA